LRISASERANGVKTKGSDRVGRRTADKEGRITFVARVRRDHDINRCVRRRQGDLIGGSCSRAMLIAKM
jgi:hypothetical protein